MRLFTDHNISLESTFSELFNGVSTFSLRYFFNEICGEVYVDYFPSNTAWKYVTWEVGIVLSLGGSPCAWKPPENFFSYC